MFLIDIFYNFKGQGQIQKQLEIEQFPGYMAFFIKKDLKKSKKQLSIKLLGKLNSEIVLILQKKMKMKQILMIFQMILNQNLILIH